MAQPAECAADAVGQMGTCPTCPHPSACEARGAEWRRANPVEKQRADAEAWRASVGMPELRPTAWTQGPREHFPERIAVYVTHDRNTTTLATHPRTPTSEELAVFPEVESVPTTPGLWIWERGKGWREPTVNECIAFANGALWA